MAEHIITITDENFDTMLDKGVNMARSGLGVGFNFAKIDAQKRQSFLAKFNAEVNEGSHPERRTARIA